jgi:hypothetical protein
LTNVTFNDDFIPFRSEFRSQAEVKYMVRVQGARKNVHFCTFKAIFEFKPNPNFTHSKEMESFFYGFLKIPKDW